MRKNTNFVPISESDSPFSNLLAHIMQKPQSVQDVYWRTWFATLIHLRPDTRVGGGGHGYDAWLGFMLSLQTEVMNTIWYSQWIEILASCPNIPVVVRNMIIEHNNDKYVRPFAISASDELIHRVTHILMEIGGHEGYRPIMDIATLRQRS